MIRERCTLDDGEVLELRETLRLMQILFPEELRYMGGIRALLSDALLKKLGFTLSIAEDGTVGEIP